MNGFKSYIFSISVLILLFEYINCSGQTLNIPSDTQKDKVSIYRDGYYEGISRGEYIYEPYWGITRIKIEKAYLPE